MIKSRKMFRAIALAGALSMVPVAAASAQMGDRTYEVTIENLTSGQPFSPGVIVTHDSTVDLFKLGQSPSAGIISIAEDGDPSVALANLPGTPGIYDVVSTMAPIHRMGGPGPSSATFMVEAPEGATRISVAVMLICTNDGFTGISSLSLPSTVTTRYGIAHDAGSEVNNAMTDSIVDPCGAIGPVSFAPDGNNDALPEDGGKITGFGAVSLKGDLTREHRWQGQVSRITVRLVP